MFYLESLYCVFEHFGVFSGISVQWIKLDLLMDHFGALELSWNLKWNPFEERSFDRHCLLVSLDTLFYLRVNKDPRITVLIQKFILIKKTLERILNPMLCLIKPLLTATLDIVIF